MPETTLIDSRTLWTGPAGSGKTHAALALLRDTVTRAGKRGRAVRVDQTALFVLPTYAGVLHMKRRALSRWDTRGILDAPFTTFTAAGEQFVPGFQVRSLPSADERDRLMEAALREADVPLFRRVADRPGFRARLLRLLKEVKQSGLPTQEALRRVEDGVAVLEGPAAPRLAGFHAIFRAYASLLDAAQLEDHEDSLRRLLETLQSAPPRTVPQLLLVDGFDDFTPVEERILCVLADAVTAVEGQVVLTLPFDAARPTLVPGAETARTRWLARGFTEQVFSGFARCRSPQAEGLTALADRLFKRTDDKPLVSPPDVCALLAGDAEDEALQIAREIRRLVHAASAKEEGALPIRGWRDVGVVLRRVGDAGPRFASAFAAMGVPLRIVGPGRALAGEPVVRALRGPMDVLAGRTEAGQFEARGLTEWLRWRAATTGEATSQLALDQLALAHRARGYPPSYAAYVESATAQLATPEPLAWLAALTAAAERLAAADADVRMQNHILQVSITALAPLPPCAGVDEDGHPRDPLHDERLRWAVAARDRVVAVVSAQETTAQRTSVRAVPRPRLGGVGGSAEALIVSVWDVVERAHVRLPDRRLDVVNLMDAEEARFWEFEVAFVANLVEGAFPLRPAEDILLRDADREVLAASDVNLVLPLARDRELRERRLFYAALTRARSHLVLSRPAFDQDGDTLSPSVFLRDVGRIVEPSACGMAARAGRVAPTAAAATSRADLLRFAAWAGAASTATDEDRALAAAIQSETGDTTRARAARSIRAIADSLLDATGALPDALAARLARRTARLSVSRINRAVGCLHAYFLSDVLRLPQDDVSFEGPGFDARKEGSALHLAAELALKHPQKSPEEIAGQVVAAEELEPLLTRLLEAELARVVSLLREREDDTGGAKVAVPHDFELAFGGQGETRVGHGTGAFALRGKIDRVDRAQTFAGLIDYKSSSTGCDRAYAQALKQTDLQLALYARALKETAGLDVRGVEWMALRTRDRRLIYDESAEAHFMPRREGSAIKRLAAGAFRDWLDEAERVASDAVREIRQGAHTKQPANVKTCEDCAWRPVCRPALLLDPAEEDDK